MTAARLLLLTCCLLFSTTVSTATGPTAASALKTWGYLPWWLPDSWRTLALEKFDRLLFFEMPIDANGALSERNGWPEQWGELRAAAMLSQTPIDVTLRCSDPAIFNRVFGTPEATERLLEQALAVAADSGVAGLQLDVEIYTLAKPPAIAAYRAFTLALSRRLRQLTPARSLSVFFPIGADAELYDAPTLAAVDQVVLQGYDAHWPDGKTAGPVAPLSGAEIVTWEKALARGAALGVSRERLLLSFPLYGYEWPVKNRKLRSPTNGKGEHTMFGPPAKLETGEVTISSQQRVKQYGATYDPQSASSYYQYRRADGRLMEGWFDDWWSLSRKMDFLEAEQLGGIALFALGYDNGELVDSLLRRRGARVPAPAPAPAAAAAQN